MTSTHQDDSVQKIGKYKILGALGRGSMGVVYRAQDPEIGRIVAIKVLRTQKLGDSNESQSALERFKTEARSAGNLRHPHIITVFDVSIEGEYPYIVMDFLEGQTLAQNLSAKGKLDPAHVIHYLMQIADGLDHAHSKNVIHRDIKPSNILVDKSDNAFILDFGVASFGDGTAHDHQSLVGTPSYMSPEQLSRKEIDHKSDLFSLAVMTHELLTGMKPFIGENLPALVNNIINGNPSPLAIGAPELPLTLQVELEKALSKNPADRFNSAKEMVSAFAQALGISPSAVGHRSAEAAGRKKRFTDWKIASKVQNFINPTPQQEPNRARKGTPREFSPWRPESRSFKAEAFSLTNAAQHVDRPGQLYSLNEDVIPHRQIVRSKYKSLTMLMGVFCILISAFLFYLFISDSSDNAGRSDRKEIVVSDIHSTAPVQEEINSLPKPKTEPAPVGKNIIELNDQQLLGLLVDPNTSDSQIVQAIREARSRHIPQLVEATVGLLKKDSYVVRIETLKLLSDLADPRVVPQVVTVLDDHDPLVRRWAAKTLGKIGDRKIVGYLEARLIKDDVEDVKTDIKKSIEKITGVPYVVP